MTQHRDRAFEPTTDEEMHASHIGTPQVLNGQVSIREPEWFEHRLFKGIDPAVNLHVFTAAQTWKYTQHYADAKSTVVAEILARAEAAQR